MRGEIGRPKRERERIQRKPASEKGKGKRAREEELGRKKRTFSCTRLFGGDLQSPPLPLAQQRDLLLAKARHLAFPADATGKYKQASIRKQYGRDVSAGGSSGLPALHKSALDLLLNDLLLRHHWPQLAGVLSVLLRASLAEREWNPQYSQYFWAAMEVTRQLEGLQGNDLKFRRMYQILHDKQPKGAWSRNKVEAGSVRLELALHLMSQKQFEHANLASEPFMDIPPYRDHPLANLVHGLIHYYQWFELVKQEVEQESQRRVVGHVKREDVDFSEGVGENDGVFSYDHAYKAGFSNEEYTVRLDDDFLSEDTSTFDVNNNKGNGFRKETLGEPMPCSVKEETPWNFYDDAEEDNEKSYMKKARVVYTADLDDKLFPFSLPAQFLGKSYLISMGTVTLKNSHSTAIKHLRNTLSLDRHSTAALLPLVQMMLAGADVEGAYAEIEKCCQKFSDCSSFRIKCMLLESLTPKNKDMLICAYEEVLKKDPSSVHPIERLIDMHKAGEYRTETLFHHLGLHLDACPGSVLVWTKLALCFQRIKEAESKHAKETVEVNEDPAAQDSSEVDFLQQESVEDTWKLRGRWWLAKHFRNECIEEELNAKGIHWLVFKAASAAHIYGSCMPYVLEAEKHLQMLGNYPHLEKLQRHKGNSFDLLAHLNPFMSTEDVK